MPFWKDKRGKKKSFFEDDDMFSDFDDISKMMNEMMKRAFQGSFSIESGTENKPMVYGFSMKVGPDGQPKMEEFGNVQPKEKRVKQEREPLVDVIDKEKEISVIAEMPGVEKKDISVAVKEKGSKLVIDVPNQFYKEIELPSHVKDTAEAHYKNGVLEVNLAKLKPSHPQVKQGKIKID